jgi:hypothetical protein
MYFLKLKFEDKGFHKKNISNKNIQNKKKTPNKG